MQSGTKKLKNGTKELSDKTDGLDTEIYDKIDEMIDSMTGSDVELKSFISDKNTSVNSVQFVIKTDDIKVEEPEESETETESSTEIICIKGTYEQYEDENLKRSYTLRIDKNTGVIYFLKICNNSGYTVEEWNTLRYIVDGETDDSIFDSITK